MFPSLSLPLFSLYGRSQSHNGQVASNLVGHCQPEEFSFAIPSGFGNIGSYLLDLVSSIAIVTLLGGIGEEIGWRGYLVDKMSGLGLKTALATSGLLHGLWHLPVIVLTPFYHSHGNPVITIPLFLLTLTMAGVCYGYLRITTGSIWPAALSHSAFNILWERYNAFTKARSPIAVEYLAGESGALTLAALAATAVWLMCRLSHRIEGEFPDLEKQWWSPRPATSVDR